MLDKIKGAIIGGAIGDALGAPIEFYSYRKIIKKYGLNGVQDFEKYLDYPLGTFTDDTQMTIATAIGILESNNPKNLDETTEKIYEMYLEWLHLQKDSFHNRFAGNTCLEALSSYEYGTIHCPINQSKGAGGLMRVTPIGLIYSPEEAFLLGIKTAALTHGHPTGYLSAGFWAMFISYLCSGKNIEDSIVFTTEYLRQYKDSTELEASIMKSIDLFEKNISFITAIHLLGQKNGGWTAEEILSMAILTILTYPDSFKNGVLASINHSGDSDTTGILVGSALGLIHGCSSIPSKWYEKIEDLQQLVQLCEALTDLKNR